MDFVREHQDAFFVTDFGHLLELFFCPDDAAGVMRIAENEHLTALHLLAERIHIHAIGTVGHLQRIEHEGASVALVQPRERAVHGRLDQYLVVLFGKGVESHADARNDARNEADMLLLHIEVVALLRPIADGAVVAIRLGGIAQHGVVEALANGFGHERSGGKVHVGYPKRNQVGASPHLLKPVQLDGRSAFSIYYLVKIVCHNYRI